MKTILIPTDFSKGAENACRYAMEIARIFNSKIILQHTFETPVIYSDVAFTTVQYDYKIVHDAAAKKLKVFHKKLFGANDESGFKVEMVLQQGLASSRICETATEKKADAIIMGTTGAGATERLLIGSNASRVIKHAPCIVMCIPTKGKFDGLHKIIYATDLTEDNLNHVKEIYPLAKKFNSELLFLYVDNSSIVHDDVDLNKVTAKIKKHIRYPKTSGFVCTDISIADGINYFLKHHQASGLAMYTRHRNLFVALFNPSISKRVALHVSVPLIVIHEKDFSE
jgi:nucleotide-binding universal stress UspA family protein